MQDVCQPTDCMQQPVHTCHARCCCDREQLTEVHSSIMPPVVSQGYTSLFNLLRHCLVRYWFVVYHCLHCALLVADSSQFKPKACLPHKFNAANARVSGTQCSVIPAAWTCYCCCTCRSALRSCCHRETSLRFSQKRETMTSKLVQPLRLASPHPHLRDLECQGWTRLWPQNCQQSGYMPSNAHRP